MSITNPLSGIGVEIDQSLTRKDHVDKIAKKVSGEIGVLRRVRNFITYPTLTTMFKLTPLYYRILIIVV